MKERAIASKTLVDELLSTRTAVDLEFTRDGDDHIAVTALLTDAGGKIQKTSVRVATAELGKMSESLLAAVLRELRLTVQAPRLRSLLEARRLLGEATYEFGHRRRDRAIMLVESAAALRRINRPCGMILSGCLPSMEACS